jgi:hypothetical protein
LILESYIKKFPLKTKKHISFIKWCKILNLVKEKNHLSIEGLNYIQKLAKSLNKNLN